jgi:uncharacterized protein (DUF1800 family)
MPPAPTARPATRRRPPLSRWLRLAALLLAAPGLGLSTASAAAPPQVCFYQLANYQGASFCASADAATMPAGFDNVVSSVRVPAGQRVELYQTTHYRGWTLALAGDVPSLAAPNFDNITSSFRIGGGAPPAAPVSKSAAARLLVQATYGPTMTEIDQAAALGPAAWVDQQFATPSMDTHWAYVMVRKGPIGCTVCNAQYINATMESFWTQAVRGPDQLRQRLVLALSEIFVVSTVNSAVEIQPDAHASYLDMLSRNAFGNFRLLLEQVSTHPTMAHYLSHMKNDKEDPLTGRLPDENYAREVMQLFTIGLWMLNEDGSRKKDSQGKDIPSYGQNDVMGLAKVFTGWSWGGADKSEERWHGWLGANWKSQLQNYPAHHSPGEKRFLGTVVPAGTSGTDSLKRALDTLFKHPNTGPFIGSQLIKRFVTSNPSPAYVARVARAFADNGAGVRGDMRAVMRAVLLDQEARDEALASGADWGKLREPMVRFGNWMRAFNASSPSGYYSIWNLEDPVSSIGQNPLRAPSVFNWFRPGYAPPGEILTRGLVAPEFQITHETTVTGYANFVTSVVQNGFGWNETNIRSSYSSELALAGNTAALMDRLNLLLVAGRMSSATRSTILTAVNAVPAGNPAQRVHTAVALTMLSPEFIVQK